MGRPGRVCRSASSRSEPTRRDVHHPWNGEAFRPVAAGGLAGAPHPPHFQPLPHQQNRHTDRDVARAADEGHAKR